MFVCSFSRLFFFIKQKTAYEMRISDWSSDVCSSDLMAVFNYEWTATLVLIFFAVFMLPVFLRARLFTIPEYLERRYDRRARLAYSAFTILAILFIEDRKSGV